MIRLRTIIESDQVSSEFDRLRGKYRRFEEWWFGWSWRISRVPFEDASVLRGSYPEEYSLKSSEYGGIVGVPFVLTWFYTVTDDEVTLIAVRVVENDLD